VWQPDKPQAQMVPPRGRAQNQRGRGGFQGCQQQIMPQTPLQNRSPHPQLQQNMQDLHIQLPDGAPQDKSKQVQSETILEGRVEIDPRYRLLTYYNCGETGHFIGICRKPKLCFICVVPRHYMSECSFWKRSPLAVMYVGSANKGLGFYHIDLPKTETTRWLNLANCGVVKISRGSTSLAELEKELLEIFAKSGCGR
jgi:hypothetical protein